MIAQAVAVLKQEERFALKILRRQSLAVRKRMMSIGGEDKFIRHQARRLNRSGAVGQRDQGGVQASILQRFNQAMGQILAQEKLQIRKAAADEG